MQHSILLFVSCWNDHLFFVAEYGFYDKNQCKQWWDAAFSGISSVSTLFCKFFRLWDTQRRMILPSSIIRLLDTAMLNNQYLWPKGHNPNLEKWLIKYAYELSFNTSIQLRTIIDSPAKCHSNGGSLAVSLIVGRFYMLPGFRWTRDDRLSLTSHSAFKALGVLEKSVLFCTIRFYMIWNSTGDKDACCACTHCLLISTHCNFKPSVYHARFKSQQYARHTSR